MKGHFMEILGSTLSAIGTIEAAIGTTPFRQISEKTSYQLRLTGNVLQASGAALSADGQRSISLEKLGNEIQAVGNSTVVTGLLIDYESDKSKRVVITGSWIQALGCFVELPDEFFDQTAFGKEENIIGCLLQGIGNSMQAIGGKEELELHLKPSFHSKLVVGSWIQTVGAVISLIGQIKEELEEMKIGIRE